MGDILYQYINKLKKFNFNFYKIFFFFFFILKQRNNKTIVYLFLIV